MTHLPSINQNAKHSQTRSVQKSSSQQSDYSGSSTTADNNKYYPFIDKNNAFKYIRDHLASKHLENTNRPNFNIAGIAPITDEEKTLKYFYFYSFSEYLNLMDM
jgi:hypothetical protein